VDRLGDSGIGTSASHHGVFSPRASRPRVCREHHLLASCNWFRVFRGPRHGGNSTVCAVSRRVDLVFPGRTRVLTSDPDRLTIPNTFPSISLNLVLCLLYSFFSCTSSTMCRQVSTSTERPKDLAGRVYGLWTSTFPCGRASCTIYQGKASIGCEASFGPAPLFYVLWSSGILCAGERYLFSRFPMRRTCGK